MEQCTIGENGVTWGALACPRVPTFTKQFSIVYVHQSFCLLVRLVSVVRYGCGSVAAYIMCIIYSFIFHTLNDIINEIFYTTGDYVGSIGIICKILRSTISAGIVWARCRLFTGGIDRTNLSRNVIISRLPFCTSYTGHWCITNVPMDA